MAQIFSRRATRMFRAVLSLGVLGVASAVGLALVYVRTGGYWNVGRSASQPIPFQHDLHAGGALGLDCRFCHTAAERSARAGMPSATTCLTCHSRIWQAATLLEPLRTSVALDQPVRWSSVSRLPAHAHFHHGVHGASGIGCATCHGEVARMTRTFKAETLSMAWCLDCHRRSVPGKPAGDKDALAALARITDPVGAVPLLASCSTCHR